jgi:N-formylglutamate amidohydrolase
MELFTVHLPRSPEVPIVANLPHSGLFLPDLVTEQLLPEFIQALPHTDWHLDQLYRSLPDLGITLLQANYSRYCVDLNRSLQQPWFGSFWRSVVPAETAFGQPIYRIQPTNAQIEARVEQFYRPYHAKLAALLQAKIDQFGQVYLFDLHSFLGLISDQICLGNANGQTCSDQLISVVEAHFIQQGYQVVKNKVFTGGYITRHYGQLPQVEALQIETRYTVYLGSDQWADQAELPHPPVLQVPQLTPIQQAFEAIFTAIVRDLCSVVLP